MYIYIYIYAQLHNNIRMAKTAKVILPNTPKPTNKTRACNRAASFPISVFCRLGDNGK